MNAAIMRRAIEYLNQFGAPIISHCEDLNLSSGGVMNEGAFSTRIGLRGIPALAESSMVERDIMLAKEFCKKNGTRLHIAHVSTARSVELIRRAKSDGVAVTCETAPHYFALTEGEVEGYNTNAKVNPPLRTEKDIEAIIKGLKDGTIDVIATDHAPHTTEDKNVEFDVAASGIIGLETAVPITFSELVGGRVIPLKTVVEKLTSNPAKILGLKKGTLKVGSDADVVIIDPENEYEIDVTKFASKSRNSPFSGWKVKGSVEVTIVGGKMVVKAGKLEV
jgi:dihydroorotase